jgi:thiamine kinase-like enzyme
MTARPDELAARAALERVVAGDARMRNAELEPLAGGTHRRTWLVKFADGARAVLRAPVRRSYALLDLASEVRALTAAADAGIAPGVIAADPECGVLLTHYLPGSPWTPADARKQANIEKLTGVLRTLHALPAELPVFAAERIAQRYLAALTPAGVRDAHAMAWKEELATLAQRYDACYSPTAFCHNDLVAANVLDDGNLVLVDFEYAVRAEPLLDLANVAGMNHFDGDTRRELLAAYRRAEPTRVELEELERLVRMVRLMAWFWALVGQASADDSSLYAPHLAELGARLREDDERWRT